MEKSIKSYSKNLVIRYVSLIIIAILFYYSNIIKDVLLFFTIHPVNLLININHDSIIGGNVILVGSIAIEIIPACLALSAFFLLICLNMLTPMKPKKRLYSIIFSILLLLVINIYRILFFSIKIINNSYSENIHLFAWYFLSTILVTIIWFLTIWLFKIKSVPAYTDIKRIISSYR